MCPSFLIVEDLCLEVVFIFIYCPLQVELGILVYPITQAAVTNFQTGANTVLEWSLLLFHSDTPC